MATIKEFQGDYRWLSNFTQCTITLGDEVYPSVEHAYMSAKTDDVNWKNKCSSGKFTAREIKKMSRSVKLIMDWETKKLAIMEDCVRQKFDQEPYRAKLLAIPKDTEIQEGNRWNDTFWGIDINTGIGENNLGKLIMKVKKELEAVEEALTKKAEEQQTEL